MDEQQKYENVEGDPFYALGNMNHAVYLLATSKGNVKERLILAYYQFSPLTENDFPLHLRPQFNQIIESLTSGKAKKQVVLHDGKFVEQSTGTLLPTIRYMRFKKAVQIAKNIVELSDKLSEYLTEEQLPD